MIRELFNDFFNSWPTDRDNAKNALIDNKKYNDDLKNGKIPGKVYPQDEKSYALYELNSAKIISQKIPFLLHEKAGIPNEKYLIEGSIGQGNPVEIPWIGVFDKDITRSAQHGYYIVYRFKSDMSGVYLSLIQGWNQFEKKFGLRKGRNEITQNAKYAKSLLKGDQGFSYYPIDLNAKNYLGKGSELGTICSVYYAADNMPSDTDLINDLRNLIGVYRELKGLVGTDIFNIQGVINEDKFQEVLQKARRKELGEGGIPKQEQRNSSTSSSWVRDPNISFTALENANFKCENDNTHVTFMSDKTGHQFVEAHHLIPIEFQGEFEFSIDVPENIISLCPNCHRAFHNSTVEFKKILIDKFFNLRIELLRQRSITIEKEKLFNYYKTIL
jgi:5-methylcytosine-specific restriction enzyme A